MRWPTLLLVLGLALLGQSWANPVNPQDPRPSGPRSQGPSCDGAVGFSALGLSRVSPSGILTYRQVTFSRNVQFNSETGNFVVTCPGNYQISFAGYGSSPNTRIILKKRSPGKNQWTSVASAGGTHSGGGANQVILSLAQYEECAVFMDSGNLDTSLDRSVPSTSFSATKIN